ncbi:hypothetical protein [Sphaerisporangium sp. TRM90804]|uniref:hypothetical protein n=1 Tax=Sphaerisporangium sp. TRM90804 TaxID=3031113 RepID=UPI00244CCE69|nr:hypothetical protein [Sphaerisporangium sp. TRM90804]MDH2425807.1 hypothetical protein [Sphaerisporangium sp. TRM90804]
MMTSPPIARRDAEAPPHRASPKAATSPRKIMRIKAGMTLLTALCLTACEGTMTVRSVSAGTVTARRSCASGCWWKHEITISKKGVHSTVKVSAATWQACPIGAAYPRCRSAAAREQLARRAG